MEIETVQMARPAVVVAQRLAAVQELAAKALLVAAATFTQQARAAVQAAAALARLTLTLAATVVRATHGLMVLLTQVVVVGVAILQAQTEPVKILMAAAARVT